MSYTIDTIKKRPKLSIRIATMIAVFILTFIYVNAEDKRRGWVHVINLLGGTLIAIGLDAIIELIFKTKTCNDDNEIKYIY